MNTMFIAGHGKLPTGSAAKAVFEMLAVTVEVDKRFGVILEADCTLATDLGRQMVRQLLRGYSLREDMDLIRKSVTDSYFGKVKSALLAALNDLEAEFVRRNEVSTRSNNG